jgi:hypothetical protein
MVTFFLVLRPFPGYGLAAFAAVATFGVLSVWWSPGELDSALGLVLFVQMFLASTGFAVTAHRGHFDPMLGHDANRVAALAAQWCASIAPGLLTWLLLVLCGYLVGSPVVVSALAGTRLAAFFIVSALAWSAGFALPRGAAGVLWAAVLVWLLVRHPDLLGWAGPASSALGVVRTAAALVVCPFLLIGSRTGIAAPPVCAAVAFALAWLLITWRSGSVLDVYLVERS